MGGGRGGSSAGSINYPGYMKYHHAYVLGSSTDIGEGYAAAFTKPTYDIVELMNAAWSATSPFASYSAVDPDDFFFEDAHTIVTYNSQVYKLLEDLQTFDPDTSYATYGTDAAATAMIAAFSTDLATEYNSRIIPLLNVGFSDLNASMSSAYTIGLANVAAQQTRAVATFTGEIKTKIALQRVQIKKELLSAITHMGAEIGRVYLAAKREQDDNDLNYAHRDTMYDLDIYKPYTQVASAISGASTPSSSESGKPSVLGAAISGAGAGALAGASIGAAGGPIGMAGGAAIGAGIGIASTM